MLANQFPHRLNWRSPRLRHTRGLEFGVARADVWVDTRGGRGHGVGWDRLFCPEHQGRLLVVFDGIYDRTIAEALRGVLLCVDSSQVAPSADPDEFNDHQLVGLKAVDVDGNELGTVRRIEHAPASDLLVIDRPAGGTALVPFVKAIVPEVDLAAGRVVLTPPEGLLDL